MQTGRAYGQKLMNDRLLELIQSEQVELKEAYLKAPDKETFMAALKRAGIDGQRFDDVVRSSIIIDRLEGANGSTPSNANGTRPR